MPSLGGGLKSVGNENHGKNLMRGSDIITFEFCKDNLG